MGSKTDISCDFVVRRLRERGACYLRLNSEDLPSLGISFDPFKLQFDISIGSEVVRISNDYLQSIWFRRPVYLREYGIPHDLDEQYARIQWAALTRSLMVFEQCTWMNHPAATYRAEHKTVQLSVANQIGFAVPRTTVSNEATKACISLGLTNVAVKGLDTVLVRSATEEVFGYTVFANSSELSTYPQPSAPMILQQCLRDKIDLRVTVVGGQVFCASITSKGAGIDGDWRKHKDNVSFESYGDLPKEVEDNCRKLVQHFGLTFGAIDLALCGDNYYFLEINPTGEWAWLVDTPGQPIDTAIAEFLMHPSGHAASGVR